MPKQVTTIFTKLKEHKGTIRFNATTSTDENGQPVKINPVRDIYVDRSLSNGQTLLKVTFETQ
jgi:hypothetical protein